MERKRGEGGEGGRPKTKNNNDEERKGTKTKKSKGIEKGRYYRKKTKKGRGEYPY